ncbi:uncharacterized protein LOC105637447 isoform X1 [Jatropha curcas]|uniref:uncharacterized protein LOC105637447 isoform X1 n=1 Tax=Jatropha curcas TaxID=180498 RepID=UPI0005FB78E6|nr:uncharacterized protein LOC105637447 isoform X1 [Jatropha curcas]
MAMFMVVSLPKLNYLTMMLPSLPWRSRTNTNSTSLRHFLKPSRCAPLQQQLQEEQVDSGIMCEPCNGKGWLLCDFCKGQKTNVKAENKRIYRRCPSCRAIGYILCPKCRVFKCVTFPNYSDGEDPSL